MATHRSSVAPSILTSVLSMWIKPVGGSAKRFLSGLSAPVSGRRLMPRRVRNSCVTRSGSGAGSRALAIKVVARRQDGVPSTSDDDHSLVRRQNRRWALLRPDIGIGRRPPNSSFMHWPRLDAVAPLGSAFALRTRLPA